MHRAGSIADAQLLDQFSRDAVRAVTDTLTASSVAVQLHLAERGDVRQQRTGPTPAPQQSHGVCESDTVDNSARRITSPPRPQP